MDSPLEKYKDTLRRLYRLTCLGRQASPAADRIRETLDEVWVDVPEQDKPEALAYSADLFKDSEVHPDQDS